MQPFALSAVEASELIHKRELSCEDLARSTLAQIARYEPEIRAFAYLDPEAVVRRARELDKLTPGHALHGLTFAIKDVIETFDMPTTYNTPAYASHRSGKDAACVATVRALGALVVGKTDTVEFGANGRPAATRNPHNLMHTPGGSSSGSAAAIAAGMAQLAFGTQTGGSIIRPAAYNGVFGFKPTHGVTSSEGAKVYAPSLDTIGWYGRSVADLSLVADALRICDEPSNVPVALRGLKVGLYRGPHWDKVDASGKAALESTAAALAREGAEIVELALPADFESLSAAQQIIIRQEGRRSFLPELLSRPDVMHPLIRQTAENVVGYRHSDLVTAYDTAAMCRSKFDALFRDSGHLDVVLTPPALGEAPYGLDDTGSPACNSIWTLLHAPCISMPTGLGSGGLPVGIQMVTARFGDRRLLDVAWAIQRDLGLGVAPCAHMRSEI
ncbi:amidase [Cupriavidus pauculus]|uniref:Amidase n=1 Tax=Cupriavidus pauculus TaxID=82633 RepID=A0A2N5C2N7_9BURK|nr:amidase [Cupriavidus pauculus]PLP96477.1 amidase [Cupriavidus pauculus]